ncbi:MAG: Trk system potassium transporter TrkA [Prevotella sp.]|nr:Trk system potassium transporter TrkA [Prevotella sp.]
MRIVIAGAGSVGSHLARLFAKQHTSCVLIDDDAERLNNLEQQIDVMTMPAAPTNISALQQAGVEGADLFVGVTRMETRNLVCCALAKQLGAQKTIARIDNYEYLRQDNRRYFQQLGIDELIYPEVLAAHDIVNGLKMSWVRQRWDVYGGALVLLGIKLRKECKIFGQPLKDICGADDPYHIVALKRGEETLIPGGMDQLQQGDLAYFMTTPEYIGYIREVVGKEKYEDVSNVIIMGGGKTALRAALATPDYMDVKIIEMDAARCDELNTLLGHSSAMVIHGDGRDLALLQEENIGHTQAFVALTGNAETNILACLAAKKLGVRKTIARVEHFDYISTAQQLDIGTIVNKKSAAASYIYQQTLPSNVRNLRSLMVVDADVAEMQVEPGARVTCKPVKELGLPRGIALGGLVRNGQGILINGNTQIEAGDVVMVFCHEQNMKRVEHFFKVPKLFNL